MNRQPHATRVSSLVVALLATALLIGCSSGPVVSDNVPNDEPASQAPDDEKTPKDETADPPADGPAPVTTPVSVETTDLAGYQAAIEKHKGKVVVVDFWATWCEPCVEKFPHIVELSQQFPADKVAFVSVSLDDPEEKEKVVEFLTKQRAGDLTNLHSSLDVADAFDAFDIADGIPNYKLYDVNGEVKYRFALNANEKQDVLVAEELDIKLREMLAE